MLLPRHAATTHPLKRCYAVQVAQRLGMPMLGCNIPGHFFVSPADPELEFLIDPFSECRRRSCAVAVLAAGQLVHLRLLGWCRNPVANPTFERPCLLQAARCRSCRMPRKRSAGSTASQ